MTMSDTRTPELTGGALKRQLGRALRRQKLRALMLIAPLLIFIFVGFLMPIVSMLMRSVENNIVVETLPQTIAALDSWDVDSTELPPEPVFRALVADLQVAIENRTALNLARRMNFEAAGWTTMMRRAQREMPDWDLETDGPFRERVLDLHRDWGALETWRSLKAYSSPYTTGYYLAAVDLTMVSGHVEAVPDNQALHLMLFWRTAWMSGLICFMTLILGYPVAFLLANIKERHANLLLILVLLPFMILPLYSVMKTIPPSYVRAAKSLGANDWTAFWRVYFPQSVPGIGAGAILVFIMAMGYYITPELVGGPSGMFISNRIAHQWYVSGNWGLVGALGTILLLAVLVLYWVYDRVVGIDNVKLG